MSDIKDALQQGKYGNHPWRIIETSFDIETNFVDETIFALGNGYIGTRGRLEEGYRGSKSSGKHGTYINGFYESYPIHYGEKAYGYAKNNQVMVNVADATMLKISMEDETLDLLKGKLLEYERVLDMRAGILYRNYLWESPKGRRLKVEFKKVVSLVHKHLLAVDLKIIPLNFSGEICVTSVLEGLTDNVREENDPRVGSKLQKDALRTTETLTKNGFYGLIQQTENTDMKLVAAMNHDIKTSLHYTSKEKKTDTGISCSYSFKAKQGDTLYLTKYIAYHTTKDTREKQLISRARDMLDIGTEVGFSRLLEKQKKYLDIFWKDAFIEIKGDPLLQQGLNFNLFHLLQSVGKDGTTNIAAKGLTGQGYNGHYFWDTEIYIFPFFLYTQPQIAKELLKYRYSILDKARERAREMAHSKGALYPWRTIGGEECSAYYPAGTAQYHINADIIYALKKYMEATEDIEFFLSYGAEMLFETARIWVDVGIFNEKKQNQFCIHCVTGPDEYTAMVNNNFYTNVMAKTHLQYAYDMAKFLQEFHPQQYRAIAKKIDLDEKEVTDWGKAAASMYIPYDPDLGIYPQDDSFLEKKKWDFHNTPKENYPLLLHYHPLVIYRHQVLKQADTILALFLLGNQFKREDKVRNYQYYETITTHDSSLSHCIYSIIAAEIGYEEDAHSFFQQNVRMDLEDHHKNTHYGVHTANMGGTWMCIVHGFAGMRSYEGMLSFKPKLPKAWDSCSFSIIFKGCRLQVTIEKKKAYYQLLTGGELSFYHYDEAISLKEDNRIIERAL
ncbi:alpha,alpha-trehalose phosphorylase [Natronincola peptidivorans]|uniref:Alpha,alpha-trehalose phosphorylase n=1 Tax=Natronincola peptidivorans TaxID=426128 RepID=A0A1I0A5Z3_9FIRM|nr:glycosyl hydrolase family 65 protein [Natronincola peptidivorans]SES89533.1 alpha,alpha-trehalose phosphorylase [Natronincola peptidivorans]